MAPAPGPGLHGGYPCHLDKAANCSLTEWPPGHLAGAGRCKAQAGEDELTLLEETQKRSQGCANKCSVSTESSGPVNMGQPSLKSTIMEITDETFPGRVQPSASATGGALTPTRGTDAAALLGTFQKNESSPGQAKTPPPGDDDFLLHAFPPLKRTSRDDGRQGKESNQEAEVCVLCCSGGISEFGNAY
ncbi:hypothetical protein CB1_001830002 [Camelus ferus]|nr:hypothetical protein CB1_001830002 [Camelus ferus]